MDTTRTVVDTSKVTDRRALNFATFAEIRRDLEALEAAHRAGTLRTTGNWKPGQVLSHIAAFMSYPYEGYPAELGTPPWLIRVILKAQKNKFIHKRMPVGVKIPGVRGGTVGADDAPFEQASARLRSAMDRMEKAPPAINNPIFGPLTHEEWMQMQCRHAELHLGFLHPR